MRARPTPAWAWTVLGTWAALVLLVGSLLLGRHLIALPRPELGAVATRAWAGLRAPADRARWLAVHVLYAGCRCSGRVVDHLVQAPRLPAVSEVVLWVGQDPESQARHFSGALFGGFGAHALDFSRHLLSGLRLHERDLRGMHLWIDSVFCRELFT